MGKISFDDFQKVELKIGKIVSAERVEKSDKLLKLEVDFGDEERQVISGIALEYKAEDLVGKSFVFVTNLEPRTILGLESQAMILAADFEGKAILVQPEKETPAGTKLR